MKVYVVQYTEHASGILGIYLSREEAEKSQSKYEFETYIEEHETKTEEEDGEDIFEEYYPYLGGVETSKEDLMKHFKCFLDFPEHCGVFIVRWKENDKFRCRYSLNEYIEMINKKVEGE
jgi:hypothetical protein